MAKQMEEIQKGQNPSTSKLDQINTLIYRLGEQAGDVFLSMNSPEDPCDNMSVAFDK